MGHMGQEIGFCLCRLIMTVSVDTILDDNADSPREAFYPPHFHKQMVLFPKGRCFRNTVRYLT